MPQYRKRLGGGEHDPWHWCRNCSQDPKRNHLALQGFQTYHVREARPDGSLFCTECEELERNDRCMS